MNVLIIDQLGCALDFAMQCKDVGHAVKFYVMPKKGKRLPIGRGLVPTVAEWKPHMQWADLIVTTDNSSMMEELEPYRVKNYPIFGSNVLGAKLELDRQYGQDIFKKVGIDVMDVTEFSDYDAAIKMVDSTMKRYVSKPHGDVDKMLSYVSKSPADMKFMLTRWKEKNPQNQGFILQEFQPGIEMAVGGWFGKNGWSKWFLENFEHKKLMVGDNGPNTGEQGCYSADSEVLTDSGWKFWPDVLPTDKLATLMDGATVFETPSELVSFDYAGPMVCWKNRAIDICVTPNHNMYVNRQHAARRGEFAYEFIQAEYCTQSQYEVLRTADWHGDEGLTHTIPEYTYRKGFGYHTDTPITVPMRAWAEFLGLYIGDGSSSGSQAVIARSRPAKCDRAEKIIRATGLPYTRNGDQLTINRAQVAAYLKPLGRAIEKRVPSYIKNASKEVIGAFLDGYCTADGNVARTGLRQFYTCNVDLAGDVQELMLKIGRVGLVNEAKRAEGRNTAPDGHEIIQRHSAYVITERVQKTCSWLDARDRFEEHYDGKVYCATVPGHVLFVRRNGKPVWCGNTVMRYTKDSLLAEELLLPLTKHLKSIKYTGYFDMAAIIDAEGKPWPLEATARPGWPCFIIQTALHVGDPAQWMLDLIHGEDTLDVLDEIATGVVVSIPDYPFTEYTGRDTDGFPIYHCEPLLMDDIHLCEARLGDAPLEQDGKLIDVKMPVTVGDYVCVATGTDFNVKGAAARAYRAIKKIEIPNSPGWRTDIGKRLEKQLPQLQEHGYAEGWTYE